MRRCAGMGTTVLNDASELGCRWTVGRARSPPAAGVCWSGGVSADAVVVSWSRQEGGWTGQQDAVDGGQGEAHGAGEDDVVAEAGQAPVRGIHEQAGGLSLGGS